jgi:hypothetical protein
VKRSKGRRGGMKDQKHEVKSRVERKEIEES